MSLKTLLADLMAKYSMKYYSSLAIAIYLLMDESY